MSRCKYFKPKEKGCRENCANCKRWSGKKCKDEASIIAEWDKRHRAFERMMQSNRGVRLD
jgi:hypothetical protein